MVLKISWYTYMDKVYGCWLGKNAGGTLGGPLEDIYGRDEMFNVWWYPRIVEGGIPNDDLEIQLVWLQALKDRGILLSARDLAEYWLDCILYNPDEYGFCRMNLRRGLIPPISGLYDNWFKDCMGSPIRSEIWACIAPGAPDIAARYAYQDAICDHAGGESVYGEVFNTVLESSAFVISDRVKLVEIGLKAIPEDSKTAKAVEAALDAYLDGLDWMDAREYVRRMVYHPVAQYSPINLGFQTIGLLYGRDFGDAICKAVNCGWDTDCTGATVGAIWGIIYGRSRLPREWIDPLGDTITVSSGIANICIPSSLGELTYEVCSIGRRVLSYFDTSIEISDTDHFEDAERIIESKLESVRGLWSIPYDRIEFYSTSIRVYVAYLDGPAILPGIPNRFKVSVENLRSIPVSARVKVHTPDGWILDPHTLVNLDIPGKGVADTIFTVKAYSGSICSSNKCLVDIDLVGRPGVIGIPVNFVGGYVWLISDVFYGDLSIDTYLPPEDDVDLYDIGDGWRIELWSESRLEVERFFKGKPGIIYLRHFIYSQSERRVRIGVPNNSIMKLWLNGSLIHETVKPVPLRPNYSGDGSNYTDAKLRSGWNQVAIKLSRSSRPLEAYFTIADSERYGGIPDLIHWKLPWE
ncbi:MAG: ADP-ribosylglycohydrolase family protein [Candidatus Bathyarchaeia archaeon]